MITFTRNEIVSATQFVRQFATFLKRITESKQEKIAIIKNNEMQAVFIPIEEYERLKAIEELAEQKEIVSRVYFKIKIENWKNLEKLLKKKFKK